MGISAGGDKHGPKNDINVTPLVDVVLVMLIIFLVAMPIQIRKISIEVPRELEDQVFSVSTALTVTLLGKADGSIVLNDGSGDKSLNGTDLAETLRVLLNADKNKDREKVIFVDFEDSVKYNDVISVMDTVRGAAPKKVIEDSEGKSQQVPDVKLALTIRDEDRKKK